MAEKHSYDFSIAACFRRNTFRALDANANARARFHDDETARKRLFSTSRPRLRALLGRGTEHASTESRRHGTVGVITCKPRPGWQLSQEKV